MDDYRAPTPATVAGGVVIETDAAYALWKSGNAVWIDVLPAPRRPANLPDRLCGCRCPDTTFPAAYGCPMSAAAH